MPLNGHTFDKVKVQASTDSALYYYLVNETNFIATGLLTRTSGLNVYCGVGMGIASGRFFSVSGVEERITVQANSSGYIVIVIDLTKENDSTGTPGESDYIYVNNQIHLDAVTESEFKEENIINGNGKIFMLKLDKYTSTSSTVSLTDVRNRVNPFELVKSQLTTDINKKLNKAGDIMTGALVLPSSSPTLTTHAVNKAYADTKLPLTGGTLTGPLILPSTSPTIGTQATNKTYVDDANNLIKSSAQMSKITNDSGGVYVTITGSIDAYLRTAPMGFRMVYMTALPDAPTTGSFRGWFHKSGVTDANNIYGYGIFYLISGDGTAYVWYFAGNSILQKTTWQIGAKQKENPRQASGLPRLIISSTNHSSNVGTNTSTLSLQAESMYYQTFIGNGDYEFYTNANALDTPYKKGLTTDSSLFGRLHVYGNSVTINAVNYKGESFSCGYDSSKSQGGIGQVWGNGTWSPWVKQGEVWETLWAGNTILSPTSTLTITKPNKAIKHVRLHTAHANMQEFRDIPSGAGEASHREWHVPVITPSFYTQWGAVEIYPNRTATTFYFDVINQNTWAFRLTKIEVVYA